MTANELAGRRVLIVEDRYLIASDIAEQVRELGGEVIGPARNLEAARDLVSAQAPDLALLDVNLEGELIFPLAEELAQGDTPMILLTGYEGDSLPQRWASLPRLLKPVDIRALREALVRLT